MTESFTAYITTYALTTGILKREVHRTGNDTFVRYHNPGQSGWVFANDWDVHRTEDAAQARAQAMIEAKIKSLDKQRAKLVKLALTGVKVTP